MEVSFLGVFLGQGLVMAWTNLSENGPMRTERELRMVHRSYWMMAFLDCGVYSFNYLNFLESSNDLHSIIHQLYMQGDNTPVLQQKRLPS